MIFSQVRITCYFHVFAQKLTWYFIGVYIINIIIRYLGMDMLMFKSKSFSVSFTYDKSRKSSLCRRCEISSFYEKNIRII